MKKIIILLLAAISIYANTTIDSGSINNFADAITTWVQGSLGYLIALFGVFGSIMWYLLGEKIFGYGSLKALWVGTTVSFFAGGLVGIVQAMMIVGDGTFK